MLDLMLLFLLVVCAVAAVLMKDLLSTTVILGAYSLIMALAWMRLNAVDVAFTEASVGAGITTILVIAALSRTKRFEEDRKIKAAKRRWHLKSPVLFFVVITTFGILVYGTLDMPNFGDPNAPAHTRVAKRYIEKSYEETGEENFVSAVLASYRGYDTLGETTVIFTAGLALILILRKKKRKG